LQGSARYPVNILCGTAIKHAISTFLVTPVRTCGDHVLAFRVVWRLSEDRLPRVWDDIVRQRRLCDEVVSRVPALQMFVSCISGVYTKAVGGGLTHTGGLDTTRPVYPAVSYWTVFEDADQSRYHMLLNRLTEACPLAEVKLIKSQARRMSETMFTDSGPLFVTLKDQNGGFVIQKINRCLLASGAAVSTPHPPNAKVVVLSDSKYLQTLPASVDALKTAGLSIDLDVHEGEQTTPPTS